MLNNARPTCTSKLLENVSNLTKLNNTCTCCNLVMKTINTLKPHKWCYLIHMKYVSHLQMLTFYIKVLRVITAKVWSIFLSHTLVGYPCILSVYRVDGECLSLIPWHCMSVYGVTRINGYIVSIPAIPHWQCVVYGHRLGLGGTGQCQHPIFLYVSGAEGDTRGRGRIWNSEYISIQLHTCTLYNRSTSRWHLPTIVVSVSKTFEIWVG